MANPASRLLLRVPAVVDGQPEPKLCPRAVDEAYRDLGSSGGASADARQVRLLQAFADEARGAAAVVPDGIVAGETRQAFLARAREIGVPTEPDSVLVAALVGQEINRAALTLPTCVALITPVLAPAVARTPASDAASATPRPLKPAPPRGNAVANGGDLPPPAVAPVAPPMQLARPPVYAPGPFDDGGALLRPWRIRPLNGLRRLFGG